MPRGNDPTQRTLFLHCFSRFTHHDELEQKLLATELETRPLQALHLISHSRCWHSSHHVTDMNVLPEGYFLARRYFIFCKTFFGIFVSFPPLTHLWPAHRPSFFRMICILRTHAEHKFLRSLKLEVDLRMVTCYTCIIMIWYAPQIFEALLAVVLWVSTILFEDLQRHQVDVWSLSGRHSLVLHLVLGRGKHRCKHHGYS